MKFKKIVRFISELVIVVLLVISTFAFILTFMIGGIETSGNIEGSTCYEQNINIERLWPIKAGCWFYKPIIK